MRRLSPTFQLLACAAIALFCADTLAADPPRKPGDVFKDCDTCPEMVVLPAGVFVMGTPEDEVGRQSDETPKHPVSFRKPFAVGRFPVLAGEWDHYTQATGARIADGDTRPGRECRAGKPRYPQQPRQPAVCMSYFDAGRYLAWLSEKTGHRYRLLSEAEREYAARAGSYGPFPFPFDRPGEYVIDKHANTYGDGDGFTHTAPAGSFPPNAFGVYDMHGNIYEWVADCWHDSYEGAPADGGAWMEGACKFHQIRGNDWSEPPIFSRSGNRNATNPDNRGDWLGFRVARDL